MIEDTEFAGPVSAGSDAHSTHASRGQGPKQKGEERCGGGGLRLDEGRGVGVGRMRGVGAAYNPFLKSGARLSDYFHTFL